MRAKPSSSTWPQIPVILDRGDGEVHEERWLEVVGWLPDQPAELPGKSIGI